MASANDFKIVGSEGGDPSSHNEFHGALQLSGFQKLMKGCSNIAMMNVPPIFDSIALLMGDSPI